MDRSIKPPCPRITGQKTQEAAGHLAASEQFVQGGHSISAFILPGPGPYFFLSAGASWMIADIKGLFQTFIFKLISLHTAQVTQYNDVFAAPVLDLEMC